MKSRIIEFLNFYFLEILELYKKELKKTSEKIGFKISDFFFI